MYTIEETLSGNEGYKDGHTDELEVRAKPLGKPLLTQQLRFGSDWTENEVEEHLRNQIQKTDMEGIDNLSDGEVTVHNLSHTDGGPFITTEVGSNGGWSYLAKSDFYQKEALSMN